MKINLPYSTLGHAYNEFCCKEHLAILSRILCIKKIDCNVNKFSYNVNPLITSSFFCIFLLVISRTECISDSFLKFQLVHLGKQVANQLVLKQNLLVTDEHTSVKIFIETFVVCLFCVCEHQYICNYRD